MIRLTLSHRFPSERAADGDMLAYSLWTIGARIVPDGTRHRIVIDTLRPRGVQHYLTTHMPGAQWTASEVAE